MMNTPITDLSRYIGAHWYLSLEKLAEQSGLLFKTVTRAVKGETILPRYEKRLREFLGKL
jgi:hypothetical protein